MTDKTDAIIKKSKEEREARMKQKREASMMYCPDCKEQRPAQYRGRKRRGDLVHKTYRASCGHWIESGAQYSEDSTISITETKEWTPVKTSDDQVQEDYGFSSAEIAILNGTTQTIESVRETAPQFKERYATELRGKGLEVTEREYQMSDTDTETAATWDAVPAEAQPSNVIEPTTPDEQPETELGDVARQQNTLNNLISVLDNTEYDREVLILDQDDPPTVDQFRAAKTNQQVGDVDIFAWANIIPRYHGDIEGSERLAHAAASRSYPFLGRADAMIRKIVQKNSSVERNDRAWADDRLTFMMDMEIGGVERAVEFHCRRDNDAKGFMRLFKIGIFNKDFDTGDMNARKGDEDSLYGRINKAKGRLWFLEQQANDLAVIEGNHEQVLAVEEEPF